MPTIHFQTVYMCSWSLNLPTPVLEELGEPEQRFLGLVHCQIFHSLQQMGRNVLIEELPSWATVGDRLIGSGCHWRRRDRARTRCVCGGCGCCGHCDWDSGFLVRWRIFRVDCWRCCTLCGLGGCSWIGESWLYCAQNGLNVLLAGVGGRWMFRQHTSGTVSSFISTSAFAGASPLGICSAMVVGCLASTNGGKYPGPEHELYVKRVFKPRLGALCLHLTRRHLQWVSTKLRLYVLIEPTISRQLFGITSQYTDVMQQNACSQPEALKYGRELLFRRTLYGPA